MKRLNHSSQRTTLSGLGLALGRAVWFGITFLTLGLFLVGIPAEYAAHIRAGTQNFQSALAHFNLSVQFYAGYRTALDVIEAMLFIATGVFIFWRKSDDWMVGLVSVTNVTFGALFVPTLVRLMETSPMLVMPVAFIRAVGLFSSLVVFYFLFPDGRFVPGWLRWFAIAWGGMVLMWWIFPDAPFNLVYLQTWFDNVAISAALFLVCYGVGAAAQIYRYRRVSTAQQRQQTKWVVYGTIGALIGFVVYHVTLVLLPSASSGIPRLLHILFGVPLYHLLVLMAPVCIGLSILSFRLWDIDFIINRSLVYTVLSGVLVIFYVTCVLLLTQFFRGITQETQPQLVSIISTLGTAILFSPLRSRVQHVIDRRFYRRRYNAARALEAFSHSVRDEVDVEKLRENLLAVIRDSMQPVGMALWLTPPARTREKEGEEPIPDSQDGFLPSGLGLTLDEIFDPDKRRGA